MSWVKIDDAAPEHPKFMRLAELANQGDRGAAAAWLWVCGLAYCNRQPARDGFIPRMKVGQLYPVKGGLGLAERLVQVGLWEQRADGFAVHDYHVYQPSAAEASDLSAKRSAAGRKGGQRSAAARAGAAHEESTRGASGERQGSEDGAGKGQAHGESGARPAQAGEIIDGVPSNLLEAKEAPDPVPSRPVPKEEEIRPLQLALEASDPGLPADAFQRFWTVYPLHKDRTAASRRFGKTIKTRREFDDLLRAVEAYRAELVRDGTERRFIKHGATFLGGWRDYLDMQPGDMDDRGSAERALDSYHAARERLRSGRPEPDDAQTVAAWEADRRGARP